MGRNRFVFGRNVLKEAIAQKIDIKQIFVQGPRDLQYVQSLLSRAKKKIPIKNKIPSPYLKEAHQGVVLEVDHDFYLLELSAEDLKKMKFILLCNHLEDVQNLGAISRSAAAFGADLIVHESRRSVSLNPVAVKVSMGMAFHLKYYEVSNLLSICQLLKKKNFQLAGLDAQEGLSLYEWHPEPLQALIVGSESSGIARPLQKMLDFHVKIPMQPKVESLNATQAASVAMSWLYHCQQSPAGQER